MLHCMGRAAEQTRGDISGEWSTFRRIYDCHETGQLRPDLGALHVSLLTLSFQQYRYLQP